MQTAMNTPSELHTGVLAQHITDIANETVANALTHYQILRRNGAVVPFEPNKIAVAIENHIRIAAVIHIPDD